MKLISNEVIVELREIAAMLDMHHRKLDLTGPEGLNDNGIILRDAVGYMLRMSNRMIDFAECLHLWAEKLQRMNLTMREEIGSRCGRKSCHQRVRGRINQEEASCPGS